MKTDAVGFGLRRLVQACAVLDAVLFAGTAIALTDIEAALFAAGLVVAVLLTRWKRGLIGTIALGLLFADTAVWMVPAALSNLNGGEGFGPTVIPAALAVVSIAGLIAVAGSLLHRGEGMARAVAAIAVVVVIAALVGGAMSSGSQTQAGELEVETEGVRFVPDEIDALAGDVDIVIKNGDLFWHTFTIRDLDVNVKLPSISKRTASFTASPGNYEFVCAIPGHEQAGMKGTLIVR